MHPTFRKFWFGAATLRFFLYEATWQVQIHVSIVIVFVDIFAIIITASSMGATVIIIIKLNSATVTIANHIIMCTSIGMFIGLDSINAIADARVRIVFSLP